MVIDDSDANGPAVSARGAAGTLDRTKTIDAGQAGVIEADDLGRPSSTGMENVPGEIRILLVDDCRIRRDYLVAELACRGIAVEAATDLESPTPMNKSFDRVILINNAIADADVVLRHTVERGLSSRVVVFGLIEDDEDSILKLAGAGVGGYHLRSESLEELLTCIRRVSNGEPGCSSGVASFLLRRLSDRAAQRHDYETSLLTVREREVLKMLELGLSNQEISEQLRIATHTVRNHVHSVLKKLGARSRSEAVARARNALPSGPV